MRRRLPRRAGLAAAALLIALAGGFLVVRDSSVVAVEDVAVRGVNGPDAPKVEAALRRVARDMTTLNADAGRLREAVAEYPTVDDVEVDRDLPHGLTITVLERRAVALVQDGGRTVPITANGRLLHGATPPRDLPALEAKGGADSPHGRALLSLLGAAPDPLLRRTRRAHVGASGLLLEMREGPRLFFGAPADLRAKWVAAARVLADPTAEGATYVDVRVPERTAAGGLAPLVDPETEAAPEGEVAPEAPVAPEAVPEAPPVDPGIPSPSTGA